MLSVIDPRNFAGAGVSAELAFKTVRDATHALIDAFAMLVEIEGHKHKDDKNLGWAALKRDLTPAVVKSMFKEEEK
jgi:hypothetical protein